MTVQEGASTAKLVVMGSSTLQFAALCKKSEVTWKVSLYSRLMKDPLSVLNDLVSIRCCKSSRQKAEKIYHRIT